MGKYKLKIRKDFISPKYIYIYYKCRYQDDQNDNFCFDRDTWIDTSSICVLRNSFWKRRRGRRWRWGEGCSTFSFSRVVNTPRPGQVGFRDRRQGFLLAPRDRESRHVSAAELRDGLLPRSNVHGEIGGARYKSTETYSYFTCPGLSSPTFFAFPRPAS